MARAKFGLDTPEGVQGKEGEVPHSLSSPMSSQGSELLELKATWVD